MNRPFLRAAKRSGLVIPVKLLKFWMPNLTRVSLGSKLSLEKYWFRLSGDDIFRCIRTYVSKNSTNARRRVWSQVGQLLGEGWHCPNKIEIIWYIFSFISFFVCLCVRFRMVFISELTYYPV